MHRAGRWVAKFVATLILIGIAIIATTAILGPHACSPLQNPPAPDPSDPTGGTIPAYVRHGEMTYLTFPEWYIVWSAQEYGRSLSAGNRPSNFPYLSSVAQFWCGYGHMHTATKNNFALNRAEYVALTVIGTSFSVEYFVKAAYENTLGRLSEWTAGGATTSEDIYAAEVARDYGDFLQEIPFYDYPFGAKLIGLWRSTPLLERNFIRAWERKFALSLEYGVKAGYGWLIRTATHAAYAPAVQEIMLEIRGNIPERIITEQHIRVLKELPDGGEIIAMPSYKQFTDAMRVFAREGIVIRNIAGHDRIVLTAILSSDLKDEELTSYALFDEPILTDSQKKRVIYVVPVERLGEIILKLEGLGAEFEHVYDYT